MFPESAHAAPVYATSKELRDRLSIPIPNDHTDRYHKTARELGIFIQTGSFLEVDSRYPDCVFITPCLICPNGVLSKYRKDHTWLPWEVHAARTS